LEITVSFLEIYKWEPDSPALHLQCKKTTWEDFIVRTQASPGLYVVSNRYELLKNLILNYYLFKLVFFIESFCGKLQNDCIFSSINVSIS